MSGMVSIAGAGSCFLNTELNAGLMFASIALSSRELGWHDRGERNHRIARHAYDAFIRFRYLVDLSTEQSAEFETKFQTLRQRLRELGDAV
jgi:hypothetical protein